MWKHYENDIENESKTFKRRPQRPCLDYKYPEHGGCMDINTRSIIDACRYKTTPSVEQNCMSKSDFVQWVVSGSLLDSCQVQDETTQL